MSDDMATLKGYLDHWDDCFDCEKSRQNMLHHLRDLAFDGKLRGCNFRSVCWRVFLHCFPADPNLWKDAAKQSRDKYITIKSRHIKDPKANGAKRDISVENPLSQDDQSEWNKFFKSQELKKTIQQDVRRTFPEMKYFHDDNVHSLLVNVLFCYACEHSDLSYRQGMHELLAPLVFIIHCDLEAASYAKESGQLTDLINVILDEDYLEHDAYQMFCRLMESTNKWYAVTVTDEEKPEQNKEEKQVEDASDFEMPFQEKTVMTTGTLAIANKLCHIYDTLLLHHDIQLHTHLNQMEIIPQVFGLRWIRLLFGREFSLQDLFMLWDALFADGPALDLVDYLFVAMLIHVRRQLLDSDYTTCLQILMKYPPVDDINDIVQAAKCIRDGQIISASSQKLSSAIMNSVSSKSSYSPPKTNKQNSFLKAFQELRRKVIPESRPPLNDQSRSNTTHVNGGKLVHQVPREMHIGNKDLSSNVQRGEQNQNYQSMHTKMSNSEDCEIYRRKLEKMSAMCNYCSDKIDACIATLQSQVCSESQRSDNKEPEASQLHNEEHGEPVTNDEKLDGDQILLTLANLKQVRDVLKGTINFDLNPSDDVNSNAKT